jgi:hypothetical protein
VFLKSLNSNLRDLRGGTMQNTEIRIIFTTRVFSRHIVQKCPVKLFLRNSFRYSVISEEYPLFQIERTDETEYDPQIFPPCFNEYL